MRRRSFLIGLVLGNLILSAGFNTSAQDLTATPGTTSTAYPTAGASPETTTALADFIAEITLGSEPSSASAGVAVDSGGTLYVIDSLQDHIRVFNRDGEPVATWGERGNGPGQFRFSSEDGLYYWGDLAFGPDGNLYVVDSFNARIQVLGPDGAFLWTWGEPGKDEGQFDTPSGIAVDSAGRVYVTEFGNTRLQIFDSEGQVLAVWEPAPDGVSLIPELKDVTVDAGGIVSVTDGTNARIYRLDAEGTIVDTFGEKGGQLGQFFAPWGIAVDAVGNLFVAEYGGGRVQVIAPDGTPLGTIGSFRQPGQLSNPISLTVSADGLLYVSDEGKRRVQVFRLLSPLAPAAGTPVSD